MASTTARTMARRAESAGVAAMLAGVVALLAGMVQIPRPSEPAEVVSLFTPGDDIEAEIVRRIGLATASVRCQAYSFTSGPIADAMCAAVARGVEVRVIVDRSQATDPRSKAGLLHGAGVAVLVDRRHAIAHNKILVIDAATTEAGSFNYTAAAQHSNAENAQFIESRAVAARHLANWDRHAEHAEPYRAPAGQVPDER